MIPHHNYIGLIRGYKIWRLKKYPYFCFDPTGQEKDREFIKKLCEKFEVEGLSVQQAKNKLLEYE